MEIGGGNMEKGGESTTRGNSRPKLHPTSNFRTLPSMIYFFQTFVLSKAV